jgi:hypothetical protein
MKTAIVIAVVILSLGSLQNTQGVSPAPDGDYGNQNTAEGFRALESLTTGFANTASGFNALTSNTTGSNNTADGLQALFSNTTGNYNTARWKEMPAQTLVRQITSPVSVRPSAARM